MKRAMWFLVLLAGLLVPVAAGADQYDDGITAYERGDYASVLRLLRPLAEQGHASAQETLGRMYEHGRGVPQDFAEAVKWYRRAADQGHAAAQAELGNLHEHGKGVPQDFAEAVKWYRRAAEQGLAQAQNFLGHMFYSGHGVPQDYIQAHKWFNLASSRFPASMKEHREGAVKSHDRVTAKMTSEQIAEAQRLAREWKPKPER